MKTEKPWIAGVGMIPFKKPGTSAPYDVMAEQAGLAALKDAGLSYDAIEQAYCGYVYGDSTSGQKAVYRLGLTGIPVFNVNNNCSTGSTALYLARQAILTGSVDCVLALGFEQMRPGALGEVFSDRASPFEMFNKVTDELVGHPELPLALRYFGGAGLSHMRRFGTPIESFAKVRAKASRHAANNPLALFRAEVTADDVLRSAEIWPGVMTRLMACPPTCGAAAAVLVSDRFAEKNGIARRVQIIGQTMTTDRHVSFESRDMMDVVGYSMSKAAADDVYEQTSVGPGDVDVIELHDCFAQNELIMYEALGLCAEGEAASFIDRGGNTYGGQVVTNPSGGLLSKGHPLGATGLAQCFEITHQLRGTADKRQVAGARIGLQHNLGIGGACVVTMYSASRK